MTRIIAGELRGRLLRVPAGQDTRPTTDRAREGLFSSLLSLTGSLAGLRFLDLYAGSGAVGLEALSRGATSVLLVESGPRALAALRANVAALASRGVEVRGEPAERLLRGAADSPYDVVFADPPYAIPADALAGVLRSAYERGWLAADGIVVLERATRDGQWCWPGGVRPLRARRYGEATLWYGRAEPAPRTADAERESRAGDEEATCGASCAPGRSTP